MDGKPIILEADHLRATATSDQLVVNEASY